MDERKVKRIYHPPAAPAADLFKGGKQRRVAAYARVSTASDEQLNSVEAQKDYFAKLINSGRTGFSWVCMRTRASPAHPSIAGRLSTGWSPMPWPGTLT